MTWVIKESGTQERFNSAKLIRSGMAAGITRKEAQKIAAAIAKRAGKKITTKKIHEETTKLLANNITAVCKYKLRRAIMSLGPSGFPFEQFFARILQEHGYNTNIDITMQGNATTHEVDILANKKQHNTMIECKYHNKPGIRTDTKVAMYTYARYLDLHNNKKNNITNGWLVTNTKCTSHAQEYANGVGLHITSWTYTNKGKHLQAMIEEKQLYPITIFKRVHGNIKEQLFKEGYIFAKDLLGKDVTTIAKKTGIQKAALQKIITETEKVCVPTKQ